jgi:hypothetical protein
MDIVEKLIIKETYFVNFNNHNQNVEQSARIGS